MGNEHVKVVRVTGEELIKGGRDPSPIEVGRRLVFAAAHFDQQDRRIEELERRPAVPQAVRERDRLVEFVRQHASVPCSYAPGCRCSVCRARALLNELEGDNARNPDGTPFDGCVGAPKTSREDSP